MCNAERYFSYRRDADKSGRMLAAIWLTAWRGAVPDTYLRAALVRRQAAAAKTAP